MDRKASEERTASVFRSQTRHNNEAAGSSETLADLLNYTILEENVPWIALKKEHKFYLKQSYGFAGFVIKKCTQKYNVLFIVVVLLQQSRFLKEINKEFLV